MNQVIDDVNSLDADGGTNIYDSSIKGLEILKNEDSNEYTRTVILMTDGQSNSGSFKNSPNNLLLLYFKK